MNTFQTVGHQYFFFTERTAFSPVTYSKYTVRTYGDLVKHFLLTLSLNHVENSHPEEDHSTETDFKSTQYPSIHMRGVGTYQPY